MGVELRAEDLDWNLPEDCTWKDLQTLGNTVAATRWAEVFRGKGGLREIRCSTLH